MDVELGEYSRVIDQYITELQKSSFIRENTSREEHANHVRRLHKLQQKVAKVMNRLERLRKHRDPNFANIKIDYGLVKSDDECIMDEHGT